MALPENYTNAENLAALHRQKEDLEEALAVLYDEWESLSEKI